MINKRQDTVLSLQIMKLFSYTINKNESKKLGMVVKNNPIDISSFGNDVTSSMDKALQDWPKALLALKKIEEKISSLSDEQVKDITLKEEDLIFHAPTTEKCSFRDFYAFLQHVKTARGLRGLDVIEEWYEIPVFYFSNPNVFIGHDGVLKKPDYTNELDLELEIACIIGKEGKDISKEEAHHHIAGYTILNDFSARDLQRKEMKVGLGPAKGKDFANGLGPYIVTPDELEGLEKNKAYNLQMTARKNGQQISNGNFSDIYYSFYEMIEHASQGVTLFPGDVIGSGTVGTGCILELRPENTDGWLEPGDEIELEIEKLGKLKHFIK
jgi:fumarylacetoacetate (FAA) hydrolase